MSRTLVAGIAAAGIAAAGWLGWQAWSARGAEPGSGGAAAAIGEKLRALTAGPADDAPVRCRVGRQIHLLRRLDCVQRQGLVLEDGGSGGYTKLTKEEMAAQSGAPAAQPPAAGGEAAEPAR